PSARTWPCGGSPPRCCWWRWRWWPWSGGRRPAPASGSPPGSAPTCSCPPRWGRRRWPAPSSGTSSGGAAAPPPPGGPGSGGRWPSRRPAWPPGGWARRWWPRRWPACRSRPPPGWGGSASPPSPRRRSGRRGRAVKRRRRRMAVAGLVTICCFATLLARLVHLQVAERPAYAARAEANRLRIVPLEAPRGRILDRAGRVLADSASAWRVRLDRRLPAARRRAVLERLAPVLGVAVPELTRRVNDRAADRVVPATLLDEAPEDIVLALRERAAEFPAGEIDAHPIRRYPQGRLAAHVLGTLGGPGGPGRPGRVGASGVEAAADAVL